MPRHAASCICWHHALTCPGWTWWAPQVKPGEDPQRNGLVLEWVYGSIVSTAEKARDGAKRTLGSFMPYATDAYLTLNRWVRECAPMWCHVDPLRHTCMGAGA